MWVIAKRTLREFWITHTDARGPLTAWHTIAEKAKWQSPAEVKEAFAAASILANNRVVFNIKGNAYRLVVLFKYPTRCWIRFVGTHQEYDKIDASTI